jgi:carboxymethylenebutenolidase
MCYGDDARPPAPPVSGPVGEHGELVLTSADGTQFAAYHASPGVDSARGILILPDVRGLHTFYKELALRFAEAGLHAIAIDYFGRTAGLGSRDEDFAFMPHVEQTTREGIRDDSAAGLAWLTGNTAARTFYSVGFCFGGSNSWAQSAHDLGLSGCLGFYGRPSRVAELTGQMRAPLLLLAAGNDFTPVEEVEMFAKEAADAGVDVRMEVFPGAPHSFFDRTFAEHGDACDKAWRDMLSFMDDHAQA